MYYSMRKVLLIKWNIITKLFWLYSYEFSQNDLLESQYVYSLSQNNERSKSRGHLVW